MTSDSSVHCKDNWWVKKSKKQFETLGGLKPKLSEINNSDAVYVEVNLLKRDHCPHADLYLIHWRSRMTTTLRG
jgi:hypothetical protein